MATKIIHKKSSTASSVPAAGVLEPGELAINLADAKLYTETTGGAVIEIAADPTGAEIKAAYQAEANAFTDALFTKLAGIETAATADQTGAQIKALYEAETNAFTDTLKSKLDAIEASATADQTGSEIKALYEAETNAFTDALFTKLNAIEASADVTDTTNVVAALTAGSNIAIASDGTISATDTNTTYSVGDGGLTTNDFTNADHTKLNAIEASATADQTGAEIKALYEAETNAFTDAQFTKLAGIETSATADQSKSDIEGLGIELPAANLTGTIAAARLDTATTQSAANNSTKIATTAYVETAVAAVVDTAPEALNTLNELAAALGDDASFATTTATSLGEKLPKAGGQMTGNITMAGTETVDGRDLSVDGAKLDGIEASADVTDTTNVVAALTAGTNVSIASDGTISATDTNTTYSIQDGELSQNNFTNADHTKLNGIEASATADQTDAEIRAAVEAATDSNVFTDADHTKLNGIAASANAYVHPNHSGEVTSAADGATVIADNVVDEANLKVSNSPTNGYFLSAQSGNTGGLTWAEVSASDNTKLPLTGGTLTGDLTIADTTADSAAGPELSLTRNSSSPADGDYLGQLRFDGKSDTGTSRLYAKMTGKTSDVSNGSEDGLIETAVMKAGTQTIVARQTHSALKLINGTGLEVAGNITVTGTVDGRDVAADGTKLDGVEASATADQTDAEIRAAVEAASDSNVFTDADHTKLNAIEASADVTDATNVTAAGALMDSEVTNLAQVKSFDSSDYATAAQGTLATNAMPKGGGTFTGAVTVGADTSGHDVKFFGDTSGEYVQWVASQDTLYFPDNSRLVFGGNTNVGDLRLYSNSTNAYVESVQANDLIIKNQQNDKDVIIQTDNSSGGNANYFRADGSTGESILYHYGSEKFATKSTGVDVTGDIVVSGNVDGRDVATDGTKLDGIATSANNYTHPNHSGDVTSSADGATTIAANVVNEDKLMVHNTPTNGYVLTANSGLNGGMSWAAVPSSGIANVVEDTSPQMGGTLDMNGNAIDMGDWTITEASNALYFAYQGTNKMKLLNNGDVIFTGNVTAYGTIT